MIQSVRGLEFQRHGEKRWEVERDSSATPTVYQRHKCGCIRHCENTAQTRPRYSTDLQPMCAHLLLLLIT